MRIARPGSVTVTRVVGDDHVIDQVINIDQLLDAGIGATVSVSALNIVVC